MLPPVINEGNFFPFKFWFNHSIQDGMYYRNELFYRLHTVHVGHRARLYHYACKLAQHGKVIVSASDHSCSIWLSLRGPNATSFHLGNSRLPQFIEIIEDNSG